MLLAPLFFDLLSTILLHTSYHDDPHDTTCYQYIMPAHFLYDHHYSHYDRRLSMLYTLHGQFFLQESATHHYHVTGSRLPLL
jgi:hypothetical protein